MLRICFIFFRCAWSQYDIPVSLPVCESFLVTAKQKTKSVEVEILWKKLKKVAGIDGYSTDQIVK